jgi:hypothetical protein
MLSNRFFSQNRSSSPTTNGEVTKLREGTGVRSRRIKGWLVLTLAATVLLSGCAGVLFESKDGAGRAESLKLDSGEGWEGYDKHPRNPFDRKNSNDEMSIMLKSVKTF